MEIKLGKGIETLNIEFIEFTLNSAKLIVPRQNLLCKTLTSLLRSRF